VNSVPSNKVSLDVHGGNFFQTGKGLAEICDKLQCLTGVLSCLSGMESQVKLVGPCASHFHCANKCTRHVSYKNPVAKAHFGKPPGDVQTCKRHLSYSNPVGNADRFPALLLTLTVFGQRKITLSYEK